VKPKKSGQKGLETEELLRAYFLRAGFFVVRGIKLNHAGDDLTDIDLWVYERSATLARRRTVIDIKDKGRPQAAERLFFIKGLAEVIGVEGAGVATSDPRPRLRELARKHSLLWIDGVDLQRLKAADDFAAMERISEEDLLALTAKLDRSRSSRAFGDALAQIKSATADRFGAASANSALDAAQFYMREALAAFPGSEAAEISIRLAYLSVALAAAAFDFASADVALRPQGDRQKSMTDAIRYGEDREGAIQRMRFAEALIRDYAPNGAAVAQIIKERLASDLKAVPAEDLGEIAAKMSRTNMLFNVARALEHAAYEETLRAFDDLGPDAKSFLGAVLDFTAVDRKGFALAWKTPDRIATAQVASALSAVESAAEDSFENKEVSGNTSRRLI